MTDIPFDDFGGQGPLLHFAHANAYPPGCYRGLLSLLSRHYRVLAVHHRPLWPDSRPEDADNWYAIAHDLVRIFDQEELRDVIGVGHSLGGVATMMAALDRPELFRALVLIEPVFLAPAVLENISTQLATADLYEFPLVKIARKRRNGWSSRSEAFGRFRLKPVFAQWSDEALWDYVQYGLYEDGTGQFRLRYSPAWEARIYSLPPLDIWELIPRLDHPTLGVRGEDSDTLTRASWRLWQQVRPEATFMGISGAGHLLTMEKPEEVAGAIRAFLKPYT